MTKNEERFQQWLDSGLAKRVQGAATAAPSRNESTPLAEVRGARQALLEAACSAARARAHNEVTGAAYVIGPLAFLLAMDAQRPPIDYGEDLLGWLMIEFIFLFGFLGIAGRAYRERIYEGKREDDQPRCAHDGRAALEGRTGRRAQGEQ